MECLGHDFLIATIVFRSTLDQDQNDKRPHVVCGDAGGWQGRYRLDGVWSSSLDWRYLVHK